MIWSFLLWSDFSIFCCGSNLKLSLMWMVCWIYLLSNFLFQKFFSNRKAQFPFIFLYIRPSFTISYSFWCFISWIDQVHYLLNDNKIMAMILWSLELLPLSFMLVWMYVQAVQSTERIEVTVWGRRSGRSSPMAAELDEGKQTWQRVVKATHSHSALKEKILNMLLSMHTDLSTVPTCLAQTCSVVVPQKQWLVINHIYRVVSEHTVNGL